MKPYAAIYTDTEGKEHDGYVMAILAVSTSDEVSEHMGTRLLFLDWDTGGHTMAAHFQVRALVDGANRGYLFEPKWI